jgi:glycosyltransferase involved in cell wall biosynthesis
MRRCDHGNLEGHPGFEVRWQEPDPAAGMFTAVLRVKNEARSLPFVLPGLLRAMEAVVVADNASDDGTPELARRIAAEHGAAERLEVVDYPFRVSRCGPEHLATPPTSVHSLTFFYNWSFARVRTRYCLKWDGDMVLTADGEQAFDELRWQLEGVDAVVEIPRYPVYVESPDVAYVDVEGHNREPFAWPNTPAFSVGKGFEWEILVRPESVAVVWMPEWTSFELKWLDADEFEHWSSTDFAATRRTRRKAREWEVFHAVRDGRLPFGVHRVESPGDQHVVDLLRRPESAHLVLDRLR